MADESKQGAMPPQPPKKGKGKKAGKAKKKKGKAKPSFPEENAMLAQVDGGDIADTWAFAAEDKRKHEALVGTLKRLEADGYLKLKVLSYSYYELTAEAEGIVAAGSPECLVFGMVPAEGSIPMAELKQKAGAAAKVGVGPCMKNKWITKDKAGNISRTVAAVEDGVQQSLKKLKAADGAQDAVEKGDAKNLKRRKLVTLVTRKSFGVSKAPGFKTPYKKSVAVLTKEMIESGEWEDYDFKPINMAVYGREVDSGYLHPLMKVRFEFRKILLGMGFEEMPTNQWVESCFWNFDALFQPQFHPARDAHDTFFIKQPATCTRVPEDYLKLVKDMHENGGAGGSLGYGYKWKREEASKNILRTHTTSVSARMLYNLGLQFKETGVFTPKKYFSVDRVFRNETMDATHLAEFHQVEFFVADFGLTLGDLMGLLQTFFEKIGIPQTRFKPAYNPYTEPSMEVFGFHTGLNCWTEVGNSGMFRPEMLAPMGLPEGVRVIAGGLSLERPTMIKYKCNNIRELFGHKIDLKATKASPIARFF